MPRQYTRWTDDLTIKAIRTAMKQIGTEHFPTQDELLKMKPLNIEDWEITGKAIINRINVMGGYKYMAEFMHLERKGK